MEREISDVELADSSEHQKELLDEAFATGQDDMVEQALIRLTIGAMDEKERHTG